MSNPLISAYSDARAAHADNTSMPAVGIDSTPNLQTTNTNEVDPARVAALANALTGAHNATDSRSCKVCGALEEFWRTDESTSETSEDDDENDGQTDDCDEFDPDLGDDDGSDWEDRKNAAVKAAVQRVRNESLTPAQILKAAIKEIRK